MLPLYHWNLGGTDLESDDDDDNDKDSPAFLQQLRIFLHTRIPHQSMLRKRRQKQHSSPSCNRRLRSCWLLLLAVTSGLLYCISGPFTLRPPSPSLITKGNGVPQNITVVLMNHARPRNLQKSSLLPTLLENEHITEVLLLHSNPPNAFVYDHPKVRNINATRENAEMGLSLRFWFCGQSSSNDWNLIVDDDMLIPPSTLNALIEEYAKNPHRIVGVYGRMWSRLYKTGLFTHGYNTHNVKGPAEVVLTKVMLMERHICSHFHFFSSLVDDITADSHPHWNGEDIFMSLVANHIYANGPYHPTTKYLASTRQNNYAMAWLPVGDVGDTYADPNVSDADGALDVSGNVHSFQPWSAQWRHRLHKGFMHLWYRGHLWTKAKERLAKQPVVVEEKNEHENGVRRSSLRSPSNEKNIAGNEFDARIQER